MIKLLKADLIRLSKSSSFYLSLIAMLGLSVAFMAMQATAMDYTVPLSRVIFLPMSMYGVTMAAFVSIFVGTDFSDGFIRNKLLITENRYSLVFSQIIVSSLACLVVYTVVTAFTAGLGCFYLRKQCGHGHADSVLLHRCRHVPCHRLPVLRDNAAVRQ